MARRFLGAGMNLAEAEGKAELCECCERVLRRTTGAGGSWTRCHVPGRIEVLGKHTDYAGGRSLLCALERGICAVGSPRTDQRIRITDVVREQECEFVVSPEFRPRAENWAIYPQTVARRVAKNFPGVFTGMDMVFASDLPRASGMSSSSALLIATYLLLEKFNDLPSRREFSSNLGNEEERATYLGCIENGQTFGALLGDAGVGTFGGSEDHIAILCSRPGTLRQYRFCPVRLEKEIALPPDVLFVIAASGVAADKTGAAREKYNAASLLAGEILKIWKEATGRRDTTLYEAATHASDAPNRIRGLLRHARGSALSADRLLHRFEQFVEECTEIIPGAVSAWEARDFAGIAKHTSRSQELAEQKLGNQVPQTVELARSARALGAIAASAFGAGFGGSVWALVRAEQAEELLGRWREEYRARFPREAQDSAFFTSRAGAPAFAF